MSRLGASESATGITPVVPASELENKHDDPEVDSKLLLDSIIARRELLLAGERFAQASQIVVSFGTESYQVQLPGQSICQPVSPNVGAFGLPKYQPSEVCSVSKGATVNCSSVSFCPHNSGTHTECVGHITRDASVNTIASLGKPNPFVPCALVSVDTTKLDDGDEVITMASLQMALGKISLPSARFLEGLVVRCTSAGTSSKDFSQTNPPYFTQTAMAYIALELKVRHLFVNLPSVDKEDSGDQVPNHMVFFGYNPKVAPFSKTNKETITELCEIPASLENGAYMISLGFSQFGDLDAVPSNPTLFRCSKV